MRRGRRRRRIERRRRPFVGRAEQRRDRQPDGRGQWDIVPIEGQAGDIGAPSLAVIAGRPAVAYRDGAKGHLKLAVSEMSPMRLRTLCLAAGALNV